MTTSQLVGRDAEVRALKDLVDRAPDQGGAVIVIGEPGIGKSSILRAAVHEADAAGLSVLQTVGAEAEAQLPFAALHRLLRPVLRSAGALPRNQRGALMTAFGVEDGPPPDPFMIALAALTLLTEASRRRPVLIAADDVHWLDHPTHEALAFIARRVAQDPIVLVGTARTGYPGPLLAADLPQLVMAGLDDDSARDVLDAHAGDLSQYDRTRILAEALGNPLALVELPIAWRAASDPAVPTVAAELPLTQRLERAFAGRTAELPAPTRDVVLVAAVESVADAPEILAAASVLAGRAVGADALDGAVEAGLVHVDASRVSFRHPLVRSGILASETVTRRQAANAAVGTVLGDEPHRRAWHRAQAVVGPDDEVADELEASHTVSLRRGATASAIWALERSAELTTDPSKRGRRLLMAAEHAFGLGRADLVDRLLDAAAASPLPPLDRARMEWLREIFDDGEPGDATRVLELCDIAQQAIDADDTDLGLNLLLGAALRCWWADAGPAASTRVVEVTRQIPAADGGARYVAALGVAEPVAQCATVVDLLSGIPLDAVSDPNELRLLGMAAHAVGEPARTVDVLTRAETTLRQQGRLGLLSHVLTMQVLDHLDLGDWDRAEAAVQEGQRLAHDTGQPIWNTGSMLLNAIVAGLRGDNERAQSLADRAEHTISGQRLNDLRACVQLARGFGWISTGRHTEGYEALRRLFDPADPSYHHAERFHALMYLAEAAVHAGRRDDARSVVDDLTALAATTPSSTLRVHLLYACAVLADDADAEKLFTSALAEDLSRWPWPRARIELAYGAWLRRQRRVAESRQPLRSALTMFERIGAPHWAEQARGELGATGERPGTRTAAAHDVLSAQELQIAQLAAQGLSNREIGQRLFLSPRTVGSHLYRIFPKLDITSRVQLASRLDAVDGGDLPDQ